MDGYIVCNYCGAILKQRETQYRFPTRFEIDNIIEKPNYNKDYRLKKILTALFNLLDLPFEWYEDAYSLAYQLMRKAREKDSMVQIKILGIIAVVETGRMHGRPLRYRDVIEEVNKAFGVNIRFKRIRKMLFRLGWKKPLNHDRVIRMLHIFSRRLADDQDLARRLEKNGVDVDSYVREIYLLAKDLYRRYRLYFNGKWPMSSAATLLYVASRIKCKKNVLTQDLLARITGVSSYTIRERSIELRKFMERSG